MSTIDYKKGITEMIDLLPEVELKRFYYAMQYKVNKICLPSTIVKNEYEYLDGLSEETKQFFFTRLDKNNLNIFNSMCATISCHYQKYGTFDGAEVVIDRWIKKNEAQQNEKEVRELFEFCRNILVERVANRYYE